MNRTRNIAITTLAFVLRPSLKAFNMKLLPPALTCLPVYRLKGRTRRPYRLRYVRLGMGQGHEPGLELGRGDVHPGLQHPPEKPGKGRRVRGLRPGVVGDLPVCEKCREHRAHAVERRLDARLSKLFPEPVVQHGALLFERLVNARLLEELQGLYAGRHGKRVARERARLVYGADRRDLLHDMGRAAVRADRQPAAYDLAEAGQVGLYLIERLGPAVRDAEAGHHLVEYQQRAVP